MGLYGRRLHTIHLSLYIDIYSIHTAFTSCLSVACTIYCAYACHPITYFIILRHCLPFSRVRPIQVPVAEHSLSLFAQAELEAIARAVQQAPVRALAFGLTPFGPDADIGVSRRTVQNTSASHGTNKPCLWTALHGLANTSSTRNPSRLSAKWPQNAVCILSSTVLVSVLNATTSSCRFVYCSSWSNSLHPDSFVVISSRRCLWQQVPYDHGSPHGSRPQLR